MHRLALLPLVIVIGASSGCDGRHESAPITGGQSSRDASADVSAGGQEAATPNPRPARFAAVPVVTPDPDAVAKANEADSRFKMVRMMLDGGRFPEAEMAMRTMLREKPQLIRGEFFLAVAIQKQKRYGEAEALLLKIIDSRAAFPEINHVFHFLGWSQYYQGKLAEARQSFEEHLRRVRDEPDSIFALGVIALEEDRIDEAERRFRRVIDLQKNDPRLRRDLGKAHARLGDVLLRREQLAEAEEQFRLAVTAWPNHYEAWAKLARTLDRQGKELEADRARAEEHAAMVRSGRSRPVVPGDPQSGDRSDDSSSPGRDGGEGGRG